MQVQVWDACWRLRPSSCSFTLSASDQKHLQQMFLAWTQFIVMFSSRAAHRPEWEVSRNYNNLCFKPSSCGWFMSNKCRPDMTFSLTLWTTVWCWDTNTVLIKIIDVLEGWEPVFVVMEYKNLLPAHCSDYRRDSNSYLIKLICPLLIQPTCPITGAKLRMFRSLVLIINWFLINVWVMTVLWCPSPCWTASI